MGRYETFWHITQNSLDIALLRYGRSVDDVRAFKPHPLVYEMAHTRLGVDKHEILMASAHPWDLAGAISYGMQGVWINRPGAGMFPETLGFAPHYQVTSLTGIADLLQEFLSTSHDRRA